MRARRFTIVGLAVIAPIMVFALAWHPSPPIKVDVGFLGYTNDMSRGRFSSGRYARFGLTNSGPVPVRRWGRYEPQERKWPQDNGWVYAFGGDASLAPGQSEVVSVPALLDYGTWRVVFRCSREGWRTRLHDWAACSSMLRILRGVPEQPVTSNWID